MLQELAIISAKQLAISKQVYPLIVSQSRQTNWWSSLNYKTQTFISDIRSKGIISQIEKVGPVSRWLVWSDAPFSNFRANSLPIILIL